MEILKLRDSDLPNDGDLLLKLFPRLNLHGVVVQFLIGGSRGRLLGDYRQFC